MEDCEQCATDAIRALTPADALAAQARRDERMRAAADQWAGWAEAQEAAQ